MSSATSIEAAAPDIPVARPDAHGFRAGHFFVLASLIAATVAVVMTQQATPEGLILLSLTIGAAGAAAFGLYRMLIPLTGRDTPMAAEPMGARRRAAVEREKRLVLRSIKELEFDRAMGKVSARDFDEMAARLRNRAIALMKQLDEGASPYRDLIERELRARVAGTNATGSAKVSPPAAAAPARAGACAACGTRNDSDARFCKNCGARLELAG